MNTTSKDNKKGQWPTSGTHHQETIQANTHTHTDLKPVPVLNCDEIGNMPGMS